MGEYFHTGGFGSNKQTGKHFDHDGAKIIHK